MKFNEKLINLRKQKGLSQEELGYKLNVTRQTVSKWELGETTPEMSKLVEMSKIFGIGLDELTNEEIKIEDKPINEKPVNKNATLKVIILVISITIIFLVALRFLFVSHIFKIFDSGKNITERAFDKGMEVIDEMQNQMKETESEPDDNIINKVTNMMNEAQNKRETNSNQLNYDKQKEVTEQQENAGKESVQKKQEEVEKKQETQSQTNDPLKCISVNVVK